jgi:hypothetical protein
VQARFLEGRRQRIQQGRPAIVAHAKCRRVALGDRDHDPDHATRSKRSGDRECERTLTLEDRSQQRAPGQGDPHLVETPSEHGQRRRGISDQEKRIGHATLARRPGRAPRRFAQAAGVGVDANRENAWIVPGCPKDGRAITGPKINDRPGVAGDQEVELADIDFAELTSNADAHHRGIVALRPALVRARRSQRRAWRR